MSAPEFRNALLKRIDEMLYGDGTEHARGVISTIVSGAPKEYAVYRDLTGYVRALMSLRDTIIPQIWSDLYDPAPQAPILPQNVDNKGA